MPPLSYSNGKPVANAQTKQNLTCVRQDYTVEKIFEYQGIRPVNFLQGRECNWM